MRIALLIVSMLVSRVAAAGPVVTEGAGETTVDWTRGVVIARVVAPADRHAPSPAVARGGARRAAEDRARARVLAAARALPWAAGKAVGERGDAAALGRAVEQARVVSTEYGTDGSVRLELALPIEAVRLAVDGPRRLSAAAADGPTAVVVDARSLKVAPAVGLGVTVAGATLRGPVVFVTARPSAERLGARVVEAKAKGHRDGALTVEAGQLDVATAAEALIVVLIGRR